MQGPRRFRALSSAAMLAGSVTLWTGCTPVTQPRPLRAYFLPPPPHPAPPADDTQLAEPPTLALYANETPALTVSLPRIPRPSDADFLVKQADDHFTAGKRA